jgi:Tol biopolymer transport system component
MTSSPQYSTTGHLLLYRPSDLTLLGARFDADSAELEGEAVVLQSGVRRLADGHGGYALSDDGTLIYTTDTGDSSLAGAYSLVWVDRHGAVTPLLEHRDTWAQPRLSPDDRALLVRKTATPDCSLWSVDLTRGMLSRLTFTGDHHSPEWNAAGTGVLSSAVLGSVRQIVLKGLEAESPERPLTRSRDNAGHASESPDGRTIVFEVQTAENGSDLYALSADGTGEARPLASTPFDEETPGFSPDGRWIAYASDESGRSEIYIWPFPGPGVKVRVSTDGGARPRWSRDGKELFYTSQEQLMVAGTSAAPTCASPCRKRYSAARSAGTGLATTTSRRTASAS